MARQRLGDLSLPLQHSVEGSWKARLPPQPPSLFQPRLLFSIIGINAEIGSLASSEKKTRLTFWESMRERKKGRKEEGVRSVEDAGCRGEGV